MSTQNSAANKQVGRGLAYLASIQKTEGNIAGDSPTANAVIVQCLAGNTDPVARKICKNLTSWLLGRKQPDGSFGCGLHTTCCILRALHLADKALVTSDMLGALARQLIEAEYKVGGPYRGVAGEPQPDVGINALIADLTRRLDAQLPDVEAYVQGALRSNQADSAFYKGAPCLPGFPQKYQAVDLLAVQRADGSWPPQAYCREDDGTWHMSAAVSTALAIQALQPAPIATDSTAHNQAGHDDDASYDQVIHTIEQEIASLQNPLRQTGKHLLARIMRADRNHEISLLPFAFANHLRTPAVIPQARLLHLGVANLYNWMAYTIYDDFLDGSGDPLLLSMANVSLRAAVGHFQAGTPGMPAFQQCIARTFTEIDTANAWEVAHCHMVHTTDMVTLRKLPAYGDCAKLAERSYSHALPALGVLANCGIPSDAPAALEIRRAFKHYLIARQLTDDLRDWEEDIQAGQISPVVGAIIAALHLGQGVYAFDALLPEMKRQFWGATLDAQCQEIIKHLNLARRAAARSELLLDDNILALLLDGLDDVVARTYSEQYKVRDFLQGYTA